MVCDGSFQTNMDENIVAESWEVSCTETDRYTCGSLPKQSQVENQYIPELTFLYEILVLLESVFKFYQLKK